MSRVQVNHNVPELKCCTKCNTIKESLYFYKDKYSKDGLHSWCKLCKNEYKRIYRIQNKQSISEYRREYYLNNQDKEKQYRIDWELDNKDQARNRRRIYRRNRLNTDLSYKIVCRLRTRIWKAMNGYIKPRSTTKSLGCSINQLLKHLELQFKPGMSWDNYGEWHVDHVVPLTAFNLTNIEQFKQACHYTNLQPLWAEENLQKGGKNV